MKTTAERHDDETVALRALARLRVGQREALAHFAQDPWDFLCKGVYTIDQVKGGWTGSLAEATASGDEPTGRILPFIAPEERGESYLHALTDAWMEHALLAVPKSRRMRASWWGIAAHYWLARFRPGTKIAFVSRKEGRSESEGSAELVWRAKFIHEHIPPGLLPPIDVEYKFCRMALGNGSEIIGIGQGADQLRQLTLTAVLGDEVAFWEHAKEFYAASKPTIEGGGRLTLISSAYPGFFEQICHDTF